MHYRFLVLLTGLLLAQSSVADSLFYEIEVFGLPGQGQMMAFDINNQNDVVGRVDIADPNSSFMKPTGFLRNAGGVVTLIDVPGSGQLNGTQARGINDTGQIVGRFVTEDGSVVTHGFILDNGIITPLDAPASSHTQANDINNAGVIAGRAFIQPQTGFGSGSAFTLEGGEYSFFRPAEARGSFGISFFGSNDLGSVVGRVFDDTGFRAFAIIDGVYMPFTIPGDLFGGSAAWGINNQNQIVGTFSTGIKSHGFLMDETGVYQIDIPGAGSRGSSIFGLNDKGSLVGDFDNSVFPVRQPVVVSPCSTTSATCIEAPRISDAVIEFPPKVIDVDIDIKPGSDPNCFSINGHGLIPVAILGSDGFDVTQIAQDSLSFGGLDVRIRANKGPQCQVNYSDGDEYLDLVCQFEDNSDYWNQGEGEATLTGSLINGGGSFEGTDSICVVP